MTHKTNNTNRGRKILAVLVLVALAAINTNAKPVPKISNTGRDTAAVSLGV